MRRILLLLAAILIGAPLALAQDDPKAKDKDKPGTPQEQLKALDQEFQKAVQARGGRFPDIDEFLKFATPFAKRCLEIADKNAKDPAGFDALMWIMSHGGIYNDATGDKTVELFLRDHLQNEKIVQVCEPCSQDDNPLAEKLLRAIMDKNPKKDIQGQACFYLGGYFKSRAEMAKSADEKQSMLKNAQKAYEETIAKYGDVKIGISTLGDRAKAQLEAVKRAADAKKS